MFPELPSIVLLNKSTHRAGVGAARRRRKMPRDARWEALPEALQIRICKTFSKKQIAKTRLVCKAWAEALVPQPTHLRRRRDLSVAEARFLSGLQTLGSLWLDRARCIHAVSLLTQLTKVTIEEDDHVSLKPLEGLTNLRSVALRPGEH